METGGRGSTKSSSSSVQVVSHYRTPVGVIGTHIVSFGSVWGTVSDGLVRSFFVGKFLVEGPLLARHRTKSRRTITSAKPALSCVMTAGLMNGRFSRGEFGYSLAERPVVADKADSGCLALADSGFTPCTIGYFIGLLNYRNGRVNVLQILHVK
jgi:hypothetical protein